MANYRGGRINEEVKREIREERLNQKIQMREEQIRSKANK